MNIRFSSAAAAAVFAVTMAAPAFAAPLFPDVPENHWARDAVATLAAKGIVEGYPDGTFKGDRAATRWEVAMVVARLLAKMEQEHATFATKAELAELQKLVDALRSELDALGVRVNKLEDDVNKLDLRVSELERITFYGSVDTRVTAQAFHNSNKGQTDNYIGTGIPTGIDDIDYNAAVGSWNGIHPLADGILPVMDMRNGTPLTNGTGFTMKAILGMRIRVTDDIDAGAEFAAYTSGGDNVVDAFWGVNAPFSCNQFTGDVSKNNNQPYTRMVLDNFWVMHNPSGTKLTVGAYNDDTMDDILFAGAPTFGAFAGNYYDNFGFNLNGSYSFNDSGVLRWEVMGSRFGETVTSIYETDVLGINVGYEFGGGQVKLNFLRALNDTPDGTALGTYGAVAAVGLDWIPNQEYATAAIDWDKMPVAFNMAGNLCIGAQSMSGYGISADYKWDIGESGNEIYAAGEYAHTNYKANKNSGYNTNGDAFRIEVGTNLLDGDLDLSLAYLSVDATYDPFVNVNPVFNGFVVSNWNLQSLSNYDLMWSLHDVETYPHNRDGFVFNGQWRFMERHGLLWAKAQFLNQKKSSLQDVRYFDGAGNAVIGHNAGFMDPVFFGNNAFDANLNPLEDKKGEQMNWGIGASYKWDNPRIKLDVGYNDNSWKRKTDLTAAQGGSEYNTDIKSNALHVGLGWEANDQWTLRAGCDMQNFRGHWDPFGTYNTYAQTVDSVDFKNLDTQQVIPYIGFDYDMSANTQWNMDFRYYDTRDKVDACTFAGDQFTGNLGAGYTAHPFSWYGWQITTQFKVKF
ncbi:MAG: S-layer homology domain-containing protein [bacterium]|nr:S-layer homology domain-containing protein [bacterium]